MPEIKKHKVTEPWLSLGFGLGEAPYYHAPTNTLRFVDIVKRHLYQVDLSKGTGSLRRIDLPISVGTTAEISGYDGPKFVFGGKAGYGVMDRSTGEWKYLREFWEEGGAKAEQVKRFRANDGAVDAKGRYFLGVMNDPLEVEIKEEGCMFRLDPDLSLHKVKAPIAIPNGISWSLDNRFIYVTNSTHNKIEKFPYDLDTGAIDLENGTTFFQCPVEGGVPDGHARDAEGCFWISCFGTGKVFRVNEDGETIAEVELPTRCVTCPGICGEDLYVTSAEEEDPKKHPESVKFQGGMFKVHIGVKGAPLHTFNLDEKHR